MFWNASAHRKVKNLALGGGGGLKTEYLFAGALGLIIVGALILSVYFGFAGSRGEEPVLVHYKCTACEEEFTINPAEQPMDTTGMAGEGDKIALAQLPIDCPKCGAKESAYRMRKCLNPECEKYFLPDSYRPGAPAAGRIICPYCGSDQGKLLQKQRIERRAERQKR